MIGHTCDVKGFFTRRKEYYFRKIFRCEENLKEGPVEGDLEGEKKTSFKRAGSFLGKCCDGVTKKETVCWKNAFFFGTILSTANENCAR